MKSILLFLSLFIITYTMAKEEKDCSNAHSAADDAYTYCKRAYNADTWEDTKYNLKKAMNNFDDAMTYSQECGCDDAYSSADDGYTYAKRGYNASDWNTAKDYSRRAKNEADDAMSRADDCSN